MIINEQSPKPNVLKPSKYQLLVGFDADTLHEMCSIEKIEALYTESKQALDELGETIKGIEAQT